MALRNLRWPRLNASRSRLFTQKSSPSPNSVSNPNAAGSLSNATTSNAGQNARQQQQQQQSRLDRLLRRMPKFLHRHVASLRSAPITHISAFLILHEITAVVPLLGLAGAFHYYHWLPTYFSEGTWVITGVEKFGRYFKRKGWISSDAEHEAETLAEVGEAGDVERNVRFDTGKWWDKGEGGVRIVVEFATAYTIVKALLIPRLMLSAWGAPWFARWTVIPFTNGLKRIFRRSNVAVKKGAS